MSKVILYTTHCPKCKVLETKLRQAHISFETVEDQDAMIEKGFMEVPMLEIDGNIFNYQAATQEINKLCNEGVLA